MPYKPVDLVESLDSCRGEFTQGKTYKVRECRGEWVSVVSDDSGRENGWHQSHFKPVASQAKCEDGCGRDQTHLLTGPTGNVFKVCAKCANHFTTTANGWTSTPMVGAQATPSHPAIAAMVKRTLLCECGSGSEQKSQGHSTWCKLYTREF